MIYRNTPNTSKGINPVMIMIRRHFHTTLPTLEGTSQQRSQQGKKER